MGDYCESMELTVGAVVEGKVKSLTKFGAFVLLPDGSTGMVHISEVAHTYVNDLHEHLSEGQSVKVMVIGMENGKINLSIKRTIAPPPRQQTNRQSRPTSRTGGSSGRPGGNASERSRGEPRTGAPVEPQQKSFDDMLKQFMAEADSKMSSLKQYNDRKTKTRRR